MTDMDDINRIAPLGELDDFEVADGDPDVRGWKVVTENGREVGEVDELLVDTQALKVRYLVIDLDDEQVGSDHAVLVPIGAARLDDDDDRVIVAGIAPEQFASLPEYQRAAFDREYESSVLAGFAAGDEGDRRARDEADYYAGRHFDDSRFYGERRAPREARVTRSEEELAIDKRPVRAGEVEVRKTVETEHVRQPVSRMREEVTVERRPVEGRAAGDADIGDDEIRVPVVEEEVVVEKRPVVKEEIVVRKHTVADERTVEADVRRERIDVDDSTAHGDRQRGGDRPIDESRPDRR